MSKCVTGKFYKQKDSKFCRKCQNFTFQYLSCTKCHNIVFELPVWCFSCSSCVKLKSKLCSSTGMNNSDINVKSFLQHCDIGIKEKPTLLFQCVVVFSPKIDSREKAECTLFCSELNKYKKINHPQGGT